MDRAAPAAFDPHPKVIGQIMRALLLGVVFFLLAGCGPRYETRYIYTPPADSPQTRQCLQNCEFQRQQCLVIADNNQQLCELQAENEAFRCEAESRYYYERCLNRNPDQPERCRYPRAFCPRRTCWRNDGRCDDLYRSCYTSCGGSIRGETVCTANCEEAPPPVTTPP
jgi:hypothetical protein